MVDLKKLLKPYRKAGTLHSLFSIHRFLTRHVFLTRSGALGVVLKLRGINPETQEGSVIESQNRRILNVLRGFGPRFRVYQYLLKQEGAAVETGSYQSDVVQATVGSRNEFLNEKGLYSFNLYFVILLEPEKPKLKQLQLFFFRRVMVMLSEELERSYELLSAQVQSFERSTRDLLSPELLPKEKVFDFFRLLTNLDQRVASSFRLKHDKHVDFFLASSPFRCGEQGLEIGDVQTKIFTLKEPPNATFPTILYDLARVKANCLLGLEWQRLANDQAISKIQWLQRWYKGAALLNNLAGLFSIIINRGKTDEIIQDESKLSEIDDLSETLKAINNRGESLGEYCLTAVLYGKGNPAQLELAAAELETKIGEREGMVIREQENAFDAYLSILPGNTKLNSRKGYLLDSNYADLSLVYAPDQGEKTNPFLRSEYLLAVETTHQTIHHLNLYEGEDFGPFFCGMKGTGKSALAGACIDHDQKYNPYTFIFDIGNSYERITRKHGGTYERVEKSRSNPFSLDNTRDNRELVAEFVKILLESMGAKLTAQDETDTYEAVCGVYELPRHLRRLGTLILPRHLDSALAPWITTEKGEVGRYADFFDNVEDDTTFAQFHTCDYQGIELAYPKVIEPLLFYRFARINQIVYDPALRHIPKRLWMDEASKFLFRPRALPYVKSAAATWRKHNAGIALIMQSTEQLKEVGMLQLANELWPTKVLLPNPRASKADYQTLFGMTEEEWEIFQGLIPRQQFMVKRSTGESVILNLSLDPHTSADYGASAQAAIDLQLLAQAS
jgi:type IV secretory pathway VirB4 component